MLASGVDDVISQLVSCARAEPVDKALTIVPAIRKEISATLRQHARIDIDVSSNIDVVRSRRLPLGNFWHKGKSVTVVTNT